LSIHEAQQEIDPLNGVLKGPVGGAESGKATRKPLFPQTGMVA